jgi:hypothetical protein
VLIGDVVAEQTGMGTTVIQARNTPKPFLTGSIPYLKAYDGVGGAVEDAFGDEGRADGGGGGGRFKGVFNVTVDE